MTGPADLTRRVVIIDDDALLRGLLVSQLTSWGFDTREADSAQSGLKVCRDHDPDAVILDVDLGAGMDGFQFAEVLARRMPHLAVVFLTRYPDARASMSRLSTALEGAAYLNKSGVIDSSELLTALNAALADQGVTVRHDARSNRPLASLTTSQLDVLRMIYEGKTNPQIAQARNTSTTAVENLISRLFKALGIGQDEANRRVIAARVYGEHYGPKSSG